jgi:nucleoside-diphosphate-sugar epimerase
MTEGGRDATIQLAAVVGKAKVRKDPERAFLVNVNGTLNALEAARRHGHRRFAFSSSIATFGRGFKLPIDEGSSLQPLGLYGASRMAGEGLLNAYHVTHGLCTAALRFFDVFGP